MRGPRRPNTALGHCLLLLGLLACDPEGALDSEAGAPPHDAPAEVPADQGRPAPADAAVDAEPPDAHPPPPDAVVDATPQPPDAGADSSPDAARDAAPDGAADAQADAGCEPNCEVLVCCGTDDGPQERPLADCGFGQVLRPAECQPAELVCCARPNEARPHPVAQCRVPLPAEACEADRPFCCLQPDGSHERVVAAECEEGAAVDSEACLPAEETCCSLGDGRVEPRPVEDCVGGASPAPAGLCFGEEVCCLRGGQPAYAPVPLCPLPQPPGACVSRDSVCCIMPDGLAERLSAEACTGRGVPGPVAPCDEGPVCCEAADGGRELAALGTCDRPLVPLLCTAIEVCCRRPDGEHRWLPGDRCLGELADVARCAPPSSCCAGLVGEPRAAHALDCLGVDGRLVDPRLCEGAQCCPGPEGPTPSVACEAPRPPGDCAPPPTCCRTEAGFEVIADCPLPLSPTLCQRPDLVCCGVGPLLGGARVMETGACTAPALVLEGAEAARCGATEVVCCDPAGPLLPVWLDSGLCLGNAGGSVLDDAACEEP